MDTATTTMTTGEVARELGLHPPDLVQLLYRSRALAGVGEIRAGKRRIPRDSLPAILIEARRAGLLPQLEGVSDAR